MKKIFILSICLAMLQAYTCNAQNALGNNTSVEPEDMGETFVFGIKGGLNYSNVYDTKGDEFRADPKFGLAGGLFASLPITRYLGFQPALLLSQKGFSATGNILGTQYELIRTTNYLDVPLLIALKPTSFVTLLAGPQYGYLLSQKDEFKNGTTTIAQELEFGNDNIRKNTLSLVIGADVNLNHLVLGARGGWDAVSNKGDGTSTTPRYKNAWYQFTVGYRFY